MDATLKKNNQQEKRVKLKEKSKVKKGMCVYFLSGDIESYMQPFPYCATTVRNIFKV